MTAKGEFLYEVNSTSIQPRANNSKYVKRILTIKKIIHLVKTS